MKRFELGASTINGQGLIATTRIAKGTFIGFIKGPVLFKVIMSPEDSLCGPDWIGFRKNHWIDTLPPFKYINHSCAPNCGIMGSRKVHAIRDIALGEELTLDYAITEIDLNWFLDCTCKSENCRGVVRSIQSLPYATISAYLPYIPTHFQKYAAKG